MGKRHHNNIFMHESVSSLTNIIFEREVIGENPPIISFSQHRSFTENKNSQLSLFFDEVEEMADLRSKNEKEKKEIERSLEYQCYLMCWNQNKVMRAVLLIFKIKNVVIMKISLSLVYIIMFFLYFHD